MLLEMADSVSVVLEFLRQHNFEGAAKALLIELKARYALAGPAEGHHRGGLASCTHAFRENSLGDGHDKVKLVSHAEGICGNSLKDRANEQDSGSKPQGDVLERCGSVAMQCREWEFELCSDHDCVLELKEVGAQSRTVPIESRVFLPVTNKGHHSPSKVCCENGKGNHIKKRELLVDSGNSLLQRPVFFQEQHEALHFRNDSLHQRTCECSYPLVNNPETTLKTAAQPACKDENFRQTLGAFELKKCTAVDEPSEFADKAYAVQTNASQSFASSAYDAFRESSWLDFGIPDGDTVKSSKFMQLHFLPFPTSDGFEQREEKQVVHDCIGHLKVLALQNQTYQTQFLKDMKLPWEVDLQKGFLEEEGFGNENRTQDFYTVPTSNSGSLKADFYVTRTSADGFSFDNILEGQNQVHSNVLFEPSFNLGSFLDIPVGQEIALQGDKLENGFNCISVCGDAMQNTPELLLGFATLSDEPTDPGVEYSKEYYDFDMYEDDADPGYERQLIEDEDWFLAHEVSHSSDDEKAKINSGCVADPLLSHSGGVCHFTQEKEDSSLLSEQPFSIESHVVSQTKPIPDTSNITALFAQSNLINEVALNEGGKMSYDGHLIDPEELQMMKIEPAWQEYLLKERDESDCKSRKAYMGYINGTSDEAAEDSKCKKVFPHEDRTHNMAPEILLSYNHQIMHSAESISQGGDLASCLMSDLLSGADQEAIFRSDCSQVSTDRDASPCLMSVGAKNIKGHNSGSAGFSFSAPLSDCDWEALNSANLTPAWVKGIAPLSQDKLNHFDNVLRSDNKLLVGKQKTLEPPPITTCEAKDDRSGTCYNKELVVDDGSTTVADNVETSSVQEDLQPMKAEEDEFEIFSLRIIHRKNRTGFEEEKHFQVEINSVVAGRYLITEYLGSAAFSKAVQARDLQTGMDVCMKIIKNNKDFFDQSLDEIKLLKFINKNDPGDKNHVLRLYDYFYHREHLFIVCELLRANLYEFQKFNRESGRESYFTMPRLQSITRQSLEALHFLHCLGLIHCDLKPENILIKSYSRCEIKVIDLGSSCFQTDSLCLYVQSRSYRAPEVILGLPYDQKIDIWSLGCILAELCSGNVLFQNDSWATLLARVVGIIGPIGPEMILKGREAHKYFTKHMKLYERNQDSKKLEYLMPKRSSLRNRLPAGDQGFVDFVGYLLQVDPENRPSASEALQHPWLQYPYEPPT